MEYAWCSPGSGSGSAQNGQTYYVWADKITWGMSVDELGAWLADPTRRHTFQHDPSKCQGFRVLGCAGVLEFKGALLCCFIVLGCGVLQGLRVCACGGAAGVKGMNLWWVCNVGVVGLQCGCAGVAHSNSTGLFHRSWAGALGGTSEGRGMESWLKDLVQPFSHFDWTKCKLVS